ncbi:MAG: hypothetical protein MJ189_03920, partial [Coriobacteriales bacterium]|nr:hypothetical protein [Coriobacteriales bacterium]
LNITNFYLHFQNLDMDKTRIENSPTNFPCPFKDGQTVIDIHNKKQGTIYLGDKTWDEYIKWIHDLGGCDYFDSRITVDYGEEDERGWIDHEHICPLFLDFA